MFPAICFAFFSFARDMPTKEEPARKHLRKRLENCLQKKLRIKNNE